MREIDSEPLAASREARLDVSFGVVPRVTTASDPPRSNALQDVLVVVRPNFFQKPFCNAQSRYHVL